MRWLIRPVAGNVVVLLGGHALARVLFLALAGLIARVQGAQALGAFTIAAVLGTVALFLADLGLTPALIRDTAAEPGVAGRLHRESRRAKGLLALVPVAVMPIVIVLLPLSAETGRLAALFVVAGVIESFAQLDTGLCRAHRRMSWEAACANLQALVTCGASAALLLTGQPLVGLGVAAVVGSASELALAALLRRRLVVGAAPRRTTGATIRNALPYAVTSLSATAFFQFDVVLLSLLVSEKLIGDYSAITRLVHGANFATGLAAAAALPAVTAATVRWSGPMVRRQTAVVFRWLVPGVLLIVVAAILFSRPALVVVYGQGFAALAPLLQLGGLGVGMRLVGEALATLLTSRGRQSDVARARLRGTALGWLLLAALVPSWQLTGAVAALVAGEAAALIGLVLAHRAAERSASASVPRHGPSRPAPAE